MIKLDADAMRVNAKLPWPVFDAAGRLLLNEGEIIPSEHALQILLERGLYRRQTAEELQQQAVRPEQRVVPFDAINEYIPRLQQISAALCYAREGCVERVGKLAREIQQLCELDSDAALGAIHLGQDFAYPHRHQVHTAIVCEIFGRTLDYSPGRRESLIAASLTANISMLDLQDKLHNQKEPLTEEQSVEIRQHPINGEKMLKAAGVTDPLWLQIVRQHHERNDGSGYCEGLRGDAILEEAKLLALADIYSAMVSPRAYRSEMQAKEVLRDMFLSRGRSVDEHLCMVFIKEMGIYPPGSFVLLVNGEVAVVIRRGKSATSPLVSSVMSPRGGLYIKPLRRDTSLKEYAIKEFCAMEKSMKLNLSVIWGYSEITM
jgi:HD-GYP domain-containing protein (c-di-GMP phosphodiesterase class II)